MTRVVKIWGAEHLRYSLGIEPLTYKFEVKPSRPTRAYSIKLKSTASKRYAEKPTWLQLAGIGLKVVGLSTKRAQIKTRINLHMKAIEVAELWVGQ
ncbi:MAG: hypothetical protein ACREIQ_07645 [Nitrospiria bacterium]